MPKYQVVIKEVAYYEVEVEAKDKQDAMEIAVQSGDAWKELKYFLDADSVEEA